MKKIVLTLLIMMAAFTGRGQGDSLQTYLQVAAERNPGVQAAFHAYQAALQKVPQAGALSGPTLETGAFLEPMELVEGRQLGQAQLMQMFPWFGTQKAARTEAQEMAYMAWEQFREARNSLFLEIYVQWYAMSYLLQKQANAEEDVRLLKQLETLALQRYTSAAASGNAAPAGRESAASSPSPSPSGGMGSMGMGGNAPQGGTAQGMSGAAAQGMGGGMAAPAAGLAGVLAVQLELLEAESNLEGIRAERSAAAARFNALLARPSHTPVALPDSLTPLPHPFASGNVLPQPDSGNPMLEMIRHEGLAYEAKKTMDRKMGYPMFGLGLQYMWIGRKPGMEGMDGMNGKDMVMPMLSVTIPLYRNQYRARQRENELLRQAAAERYAETANRLEATLRQAYYELEDAGRKLALYRRQSALLESTYSLLVQAFATGTGSLDDALQTQRQLSAYRLKAAGAVADHNSKAVEIQLIIDNGQLTIDN